MRFLLKLVAWTIVLAPLLALLGLGLMVQDAPLVESDSTLSSDALRRARAIVRQHDPRKLPEGAVRTITLTEQDLQLAASYLASEIGQGGATVTVVDKRARLNVSLHLPFDSDSGKRHFLNLTTGFDQTAQGLPEVSDLSIGNLRIPAVIADFGLHQLLALVPGNQPGRAERASVDSARVDSDGTNTPGTGSETAMTRRLLNDMVRKVEMSPGEVAVTYQWQPAVLADLRNALVSPTDRQRMRAYHEALVETSAKLKRNDPLTALMRPLFRLAIERSTDDDAVAENRALLLVLSAYINRRGLTGLIPDAANWGKPAALRLRLRGRHDLSQHFLTSAGLVVLGGDRFSDAIGLAKEVEDANSGSGFSFADIAADRAGTRLGQAALHSTNRARKVQRLISRIRADAGLMPPVTDLPEMLDEATFARRFGSVDAPAYRQILEKIERRLDTLELYRNAAG